MKLKSILSTALIGAALTASSLLANTVVLSSTGFNGYPLNAGAGEFKAVTSDDGTFLTFCLEHSVGISLGATYNYSIDDSVLNQNDPLSRGTVYLYRHFLKGDLSGPTGNGSYLGGSNIAHDTHAGLLQKAFWMLEDEIAYDASNYYIGLVESYFGSAASAKANYGGGGMKVLNIWGLDSRQRITDKQSQLIYVPDSGMTVALLGLGLLGLAALRRKL